jgi:ribosomal protein S18 acetylase RimI-like enzyme
MVRRATAADADAAFAIVRECSEWLRDRGSKQWQFYLDAVGEKNFRDHIDGFDGAEVYLAFRDPRLIGTFCIEWDERDAWGERGSDGLAGYIYTLSVARDLRGQHLGEQLLREAETIIATRGKMFARLDCWIKSPRLTEYYTSLGYTPAGLNGQVHLFEKRVAR